MALFDTVRCEYPLPDPAHQNLEFQTKDLECLMDEYLITRDGRLVRRGNLRVGLRRDVERPFHGDVRIYDLDPDTGQGLIEYIVRFTHGRVEWVRRFGNETPSLIDAGESRSSGSSDAPLQPGKWGRRITVGELRSSAPEKLELVHGDVRDAEKLLLLVLTNYGLRPAATLVGAENWRRALEDEEPVDS